MLNNAKYVKVYSNLNNNNDKINASEIAIKKDNNFIALDEEITTLDEKAIDLDKRLDKISTFSEEETVVGIWIDGKTLYRKTFSFTNIELKANVTLNAKISSIEKCVNIYGGMMDTSINTFYPFPLTELNGNSLWTRYNTSTGIITMAGSGTWGASSAKYIFITFEYTKSTD